MSGPTEAAITALISDYQGFLEESKVDPDPEAFHEKVQERRRFALIVMRKVYGECDLLRKFEVLTANSTVGAVTGDDQKTIHMKERLGEIIEMLEDAWTFEGLG